MSEGIDEFASTLLEEAKRFLELARDSETPAGERAHLHAAIMLAFCSLEAHVNAVANEVQGGATLTVHERALILEKKVRLTDGAFVMSESLEMKSLEDRIAFIHRHFSGAPLDREESWWSELGNASKLRNEITHPRGSPAVSRQAVERAVLAIVATIDAIFQAVYTRRLPAVRRGLHSNLTF